MQIVKTNQIGISSAPRQLDSGRRQRAARKVSNVSLLTQPIVQVALDLDSTPRGLVQDEALAHERRIIVLERLDP
jgi:hypothetical protein